MAVKYCGGCNPRYDRVSQVRALQRRFPGLTVTGPGAEKPDFVLVVCGCPSQCAAHADLTARYIKAVVCTAQDFEDFAQRLGRYLGGAQ